MKLLRTSEEYLNAKFNDILNSSCSYCEKTFPATKRYFYRGFRDNSKHYCSRSCKSKAQITQISVSCAACNKSILKRPADIKKSKSGNTFCSLTCSATYNNTHKEYGSTRSKLERWLEEELSIKYPNLAILYNEKDMINSELDIYVPSIKLAFELNGLFHYEPIFGPDKLGQIQNNDQRKFQACLEKRIELCIINTSLQKNFTKRSSCKYLDIIASIINTKLDI